jgi:4-methylaminobutanoate oxidase (formaldehyde-forming)
VLAEVTSADLSNAAFPFRCAREIDLGFAVGLCTRITYVGELGYELFLPTEMAVHVHDQLMAAGERLGLRHCGLRALGSLRLEKAYRDYGHDIDNTDDPLRAGLAFAAAWDKPGGFLGREQLLRRREELAGTAPRQRLVQVLLVDPEPMMVHAEVLSRDGIEVGHLRSASYGHHLGGAVGLAMVEAREPIDAGWVDAGRWTVRIGAQEVGARVSLKPLYDPGGDRVRGQLATTRRRPGPA